MAECLRTGVQFPPPPPNLVVTVLKNTLSTCITGTWGFLCLTVTDFVTMLLQLNAVTLTVTAVIAVTSLGVTVND